MPERASVTLNMRICVDRKKVLYLLSAMELFDHIFIVYTGLIIGLLCGLFPLILSIFNFFHEKAEQIKQSYKEEITKVIVSASEDIVKEPEKAEKHDKEKTEKVKSLKRWKNFLILLYNPYIHFWSVFSTLSISLALILFDICIRNNNWNLYSHTLSIWFISLSVCFFLIGTIILIFETLEAFKLIKKK